MLVSRKLFLSMSLLGVLAGPALASNQLLDNITSKVDSAVSGAVDKGFSAVQNKMQTSMQSKEQADHKTSKAEFDRAKHYADKLNEGWANLKVGRAYAEGGVVKKDLINAYVYLTRAEKAFNSEGSHDPVKPLLKQVTSQMTAAQIKKAKSLENTKAVDGVSDQLKSLFS